MSRSDKRHAIRLFTISALLGKAPALRAASYFELTAMLLKHYQELPSEARQRARRLGRKLIRTVGYRAAYNSRENMPSFDAEITPRAKCSNCRVERICAVSVTEFGASAPGDHVARDGPSCFTPLTRRIPAASSGLSKPESAASYASRLTAARRWLTVPAAKPRDSK